MKKLNIKLATLAMAIGVMGSGCSNFLDVNENPNQPPTASVPLLLPSAQAATAHVLSNQFGIQAGLWAQYWTQSPFSSQYRTTERYLTQGTAMDRPWLLIWAGALQDYENIIKNEGNFTNQTAIALMMKAYTFQMITDAFGDIPLSKALNQGESLNVPYDPQSAVYDSIFVWIDRGLAKIQPNSPTNPTTEDMVFNGNMDDWKRFGNTLKLRAYLRLVKVNEAKARAGIEAMDAANATFLTKDAKITYSKVGGNENPMFSEILGLGRTQNLWASATAVDTMAANHDPRLYAFYTVVNKDLGNGAQDTVDGFPQGTYSNTPDADDPYSFPSIQVGGLGDNDNSANAPVRFISESESYFLQAEAVVRGYLSGDAAALFRAGIAASFRAYDLDTELAAYMASAPAAQWPGGANAQIEAIITQKYFAMNGNQTFEAWTEWRRTGFPRNFVISFAGRNTFAGKFPLRFPYPNTEATRNGDFPGNVNLDVPVWWDK